MLEASVHAEYNLRNRLITLNQNTIALPSLLLSNLDTANGRTKTFNEGDEATGDIGIKLAGYTSTQNLGFYAVIQTPGIVTTTAQLSNTLSGTSHQFLSEQDIPFAQEYRFSGDTFTIRPVQQDEKNQTTNIYFVDIETGAYDYINVVNNITKNTRAVLSGGGIG